MFSYFQRNWNCQENNDVVQLIEMIEHDSRNIFLVSKKNYMEQLIWAARAGSFEEIGI